MNYLRNLPFRYKLILLSFIPLVAMAFYLQINIRKNLEDKTEAKEVISSVDKIQNLSRLLHEIQKERALTLAFLSGDGARGRDILMEQREATDKVVSLLKSTKDPAIGIFLGTISGPLDSLSPIRFRVNTHGSLDDIDIFYSGIKSTILDEISNVFRSTNNPYLKNNFEDHLYLLYTKDFLAQIRSALGMVFQKRKFMGNEFARFAAAYGKYEVNLAKVKKGSMPGLNQYIKRHYSGPFVAQTEGIMNSVFSDPVLKAGVIDPENWWEVATNSIDLMKDIEDYSSMNIMDAARAQEDAARFNLIKSIAVALFVVVFILLIVWMMIRHLTVSISQIKNAADLLAQGETQHLISINSTDELGALANSFNGMMASADRFSLAAEQIGKGDYATEINVRGDYDTLGKALFTMRNELQVLSVQNRDRNWVLTGSGELNDRTRGERTVEELGREVISFLVPYLQAKVGAIYISGQGKYTLIASHAFHNRSGNANSFIPGQGLVGQAALEKKVLVFKNLPPDYIWIRSGLGQAVPKEIIVVPFQYDDEVKGVIELASAEGFTELHISFLQRVSEHIAIAFHTAESRLRLRELLEETQRQAEELEAQQEELRQSNEGLHEKTELLEKSEAELKAQQEELQQTNEELEEKANLLEAQKMKLENAKLEIETKARALETSNKYKSEFLANMSHELRTPLNSILILSQLLSENKNKSLTSKELDFSKNIYNAGTDLLNLINEILDLSKIEAGKMELDITPVTFEQVEGEILSIFSETAAGKSIAFSVVQSQVLPVINTDNQRLQQILRNLLSNAFKFTAKGGKVSLRAFKPDAASIPVHRRLEGKKDLVAFSVSDNGIGIEKEKLAIVFEAFQQADGTTKRKYGGTGLGLSISRELAHALGGELFVESEVNKGSCFTLFLPVNALDGENIPPLPAPVRPLIFTDSAAAATLASDEADASPVAINDDRNDIGPGDPVIVIMEDDFDFALVLLDLVREKNYKGIIANQGNTGLNYVRLFHPAAILLDMHLPVMDGTAVLQHLKNDPQLRHIPVQIISGYDKRKEGIELGAFDFARKPVLHDELKRILDKLLAFNSKRPKKLLVIEDNEQQNHAIRELIGLDDVVSTAAYSGEQGFFLMMQEDFDCVIIDLGLPDMSGFALLEKIKNEKRLSNLPLIVYTGKDLSKEENALLAQLADTVVLKTANSQERLLDETMLFLHSVESRLPKEKQRIIRKLHKTDEVLKGKKVLVVDDDIRNIYSLTNVLEEEGITCLTAENGKAAIHLLQQHPSIDMVLMDVMMPEMDGFEATKMIRGMQSFVKLPILALTAKAMKGDREKCMNAGMSDYIAKPVNVEQLLSLMRVWLYQ